MSDRLVRTERGWPGHFIGAADCRFRRNTLLEYGDKKVVVSTVGDYIVNGEVWTVGLDRYYETMIFEAAQDDAGYWDADVKKQICIDEKWAVDNVEVSY